MPRSLLLSSVSLAVFAAAPSPARADPPSGAAGEERYHSEPSADIIVSVPLDRARIDMLAGTSVLTGSELTRELRPTIGDSLTRQPGVSATSFGPNASRPVLRGFQGERVRVLKDGIGSVDVSNTSVDHAVVINPLTAERIETLRGPNALLFGSSAIGGVVNVIDSRIPRRVPDEAVHFDGLATYGSAAEERSGTAAVDVPVGGRFVLHVDGGYTKSSDLRTGGFILSPALRAQALASGDPDIAALSQLRGRLPNSASRSWEIAAGAAYIGDGGNFGFSYSRYDNLYGVPVRYALVPGGVAEEVRLDIKQHRGDVRAEFDPGGDVIDSIRLRAGYADYNHNEIEDTGEIATTFTNRGFEGRLELVQARRGDWHGATGVQLGLRDLNVVGEEAFIPRSESWQMAVFTLQQFGAGPLKAEIGGRYEHSIARADASDQIGNPALSRRFNTFSGSLGASYAITPDIRVGFNLSHAERAPAAEELLANGPHAGTRAFEVGNPGFAKEKSNGAELTFKGSGDGYSFGLAAYYMRFTDYIFEFATGAVEDDLPVFQFAQSRARYAGIEGEATVRLAQLGDFALQADALGDYTRATIRNFGPAPRIPALRLLGALEATSARLDARVEVEWVDRQDRVVASESETAGYNMVNASLAFRPFGPDNQTSIIVSANNILDVVARRHASFLKDYAPLAGRDVRVSARFAF